MTRDQVITLVDKLDDLSLLRKGKITGNWYTAACPFHSNGQEKKPSFGIKLVDEYKNGQMYPAGMCNCFACHYAGDITKWVSDLLKQHNITDPGDAWLSENIPGFKVDPADIDKLIPPTLITAMMDKYAADDLRLRLSGKQEYVTESELVKYRFTVPYMYERRLTDPVIDKYDVGFDANYIPPGRKKPMPCITFPVKDENGNVLFLARRSIEGKFWGYPEGVTKPVYGRYELPKNCTSVIVCESIFNALTAIVYGFQAVALFGTGNEYQISQLKRLGAKEFILCMDGDDAGRRGQAKLKKALSPIAVVWTMHMPDGKDLNECSYDEFMDIYRDRD